MQYRIVTDTVLPLAGAPFSEQTFTPVLPRLSQEGPLCPSPAQYRLACRSGAFNIILTAPAQLSGAYAAACAALAHNPAAAILDSRTFCAGQLLLAAYAAERAEEDRFSARILRDVQRRRGRIRCFFTAPDSTAAFVSHRKRPPLLPPFCFTVYTVGSEGEIRRFNTVSARSASDALFFSLRPYISHTKKIAVVHDRSPKAAQRLIARLSAVCGGHILCGESIRTDLPLGQGGFLSAAFFQTEE